MGIGGFFVLTSAGIFAGFVYEIGLFVTRLLKNKIYIKVVCDFFAAVSMGTILVAASYHYLNFNIHIYGIMCFVLGVLIERISLGFLLAKIFYAIYNVVTKATNKLKTTKFGKISLR